MNISNEYIPVLLSTILVDTITGCNLYVKNDENNKITYILYCTGTNAISQDKISGLKKNKIDYLYIHEQDHKKYLQYVELCFNKIIDAEGISNTEKLQITYNLAKNIMEDVFHDPRSPVHMKRVTNWVSNTIDIFLKDENTAGILTIFAFDYGTYTHSVNVSVLGLLFSKYLNLKVEEMKALGAGLMLHDIGKSQISPQIFNKKGTLTNEEFRKMKMHVRFGKRLLLQVNDFEDMVIYPVMQHHEKIDGKGYPKGLKGDAIHKYGKIAAIIDVYDALTTKRPYSCARTPYEALKIMKDEMRGSFDEKLFRDFILFLKQAIK